VQRQADMIAARNISYLKSVSLLLLMAGILSQSIAQELTCCLMHGQCDHSSARGFQENMYITYAEVNPLVIRNAMDSQSMFITVDDPSIVSITIEHSRLHRAGNSTLLLKDDGTQGDEAANDLIFSIDGLTTDLAGDYDFWWDRFLNCTFTFEDGREEIVEEGMGIYYGIIDPNVVPATGIQKLDSNIQMTPFVVNIDVGESAGDRFPLVGSYDERALRRVYFNHFQDEIEFLFIPNTISKTSFQRGFSSGTVDATGIGEKSTRGDADGSQILHNVTTTGLDISSDLLIHEVLHTWLTWLDPVLNLSSQNLHWDVIERSTSGYSEGGIAAFGVYETIAEKDGQYTAKLRADNTQVCNDLELYLMGLLPADSVMPIRTLVNPEFVSRETIDDEVYDVYSADSIRVVSIEEIVAVSGPRDPAFGSARSEYNVSFVIPSRGRLLDENEMRYYSHLVSQFLKTEDYRTATGDRGTLVLNNVLRSAPLSIATPFTWSWDQSDDKVHIDTDLSPIEISLNKALNPDGQEFGYGYNWQMRVLPFDRDKNFRALSLSAENNYKISHADIDNVLMSWGVQKGDSILVEHGVGGSNPTIPFSFAAVYRRETLMIRSDGTTSVDDEEEVALQVFPNPTHHRNVNLSLTDPGITELQLDLYDVAGKKVWARSAFDRDLDLHNFKLDFPNLHSGFYFLRINTKRGTKVVKLLLEK